MKSRTSLVKDIKVKALKTTKKKDIEKKLRSRQFDSKQPTVQSHAITDRRITKFKRRVEGVE